MEERRTTDSDAMTLALAQKIARLSPRSRFALEQLLYVLQELEAGQTAAVGATATVPRPPVK